MSKIQVIKPGKGWLSIDVKELWFFRELLFLFVWRDIKVRYKQTVFGAAWAILQPLLTMVVFTIFFGRIAGIESEGIPYPIFSYSGVLLWTYFSQALGNSGNSLLGNSHIITKTYFPRLYIPISSCMAGLVDYLVAFGILIILMFYYGIFPNYNIIFLPLVVFLCFLCVSGFGLWLSALNVKYRDIRYILPFFIQLMLFATPVIYPPSIFPKYAWLLDLNPMTGIITAHRACLLGHQPLDWTTLCISAVLTIILFVSGLFYFRKTENFFADII